MSNRQCLSLSSSADTKTNKYNIPTSETYWYEECRCPLESISRATDYFSKLTPEYKKNMLDSIFKQARIGSSVYGEFNLPDNASIVNQISGNGGHVLKKIVKDTNVYLIWYGVSRRQRNPPKKVYMLWGPTDESIRSAMDSLRSRTLHYVHEEPSRSLHFVQEKKNIASTPSPPPEKALGDKNTRKMRDTSSLMSAIEALPEDLILRVMYKAGL
jgi:hypothetical protein